MSNSARSPKAAKGRNKISSAIAALVFLLAAVMLVLRIQSVNIASSFSAPDASWPGSVQISGIG